MKALDRTIAAWAAAWTAENLSADEQKLVRQANFDLYCGPVGDHAYGDPADDDPNEWHSYPGFPKAVSAIGRALDSLPSELFLDLECETWCESEPDPDKCDECDGEGEISEELSADDGATVTCLARCGACRGLGCFEPAGDWYRLDRGELKRAIVGSELAAYV